MLVERETESGYTHLLRIRVKKETALFLINEQLERPIAFSTMRSNAAKVAVLIEFDRVPERFLKTHVSKNGHSYTFEFLILLMAYLKEVDKRKKLGYSPTQYGSKEVTENMLQSVDMEKLLESFRSKISVLGKNLAEYFALEGIKVSRSSLYSYAKKYPDLQIQYGQLCTPEDIDQWRVFLKERKYKRDFTKSKVVAF